MMYHPAPWKLIFQACFLNLSGPIKGSTGDCVQRTLGLSCYTVILVLPVCEWIDWSGEGGMATRWLREGLEYFMLPLVQSRQTALMSLHHKLPVL